MQPNGLWTAVEVGLLSKTVTLAIITSSKVLLPGANGICPGCLKRSPPCEMDEDGTYVCEM